MLLYIRHCHICEKLTPCDLLASATISSTLHLILVKKAPFWAEPLRTAHCREYPPPPVSERQVFGDYQLRELIVYPFLTCSHFVVLNVLFIKF